MSEVKKTNTIEYTTDVPPSQQDPRIAEEIANIDWVKKLKISVPLINEWLDKHSKEPDTYFNWEQYCSDKSNADKQFIPNMLKNLYTDDQVNALTPANKTDVLNKISEKFRDIVNKNKATNTTSEKTPSMQSLNFTKATYKWKTKTGIKASDITKILDDISLLKKGKYIDWNAIPEKKSFISGYYSDGIGINKKIDGDSKMGEAIIKAYDGNEINDDGKSSELTKKDYISTFKNATLRSIADKILSSYSSITDDNSVVSNDIKEKVNDSIKYIHNIENKDSKKHVMEWLNTVTSFDEGLVNGTTDIRPYIDSLKQQSDNTPKEEKTDNGEPNSGLKQASRTNRTIIHNNQGQLDKSNEVLNTPFKKAIYQALLDFYGNSLNGKSQPVISRKRQALLNDVVTAFNGINDTDLPVEPGEIANRVTGYLVNGGNPVSLDDTSSQVLCIQNAYNDMVNDISYTPEQPINEPAISQQPAGINNTTEEPSGSNDADDDEQQFKIFRTVNSHLNEDEARQAFDSIYNNGDNGQTKHSTSDTPNGEPHQPILQQLAQSEEPLRADDNSKSEFSEIYNQLKKSYPDLDEYDLNDLVKSEMNKNQQKTSDSQGNPQETEETPVIQDDNHGVEPVITTTSEPPAEQAEPSGIDIDAELGGNPVKYELLSLLEDHYSQDIADNAGNTFTNGNTGRENTGSDIITGIFIDTINDVFTNNHITLTDVDSAALKREFDSIFNNFSNVKYNDTVKLSAMITVVLQNYIAHTSTSGNTGFLSNLVSKVKNVINGNSASQPQQVQGSVQQATPAQNQPQTPVQQTQPQVQPQQQAQPVQPVHPQAQVVQNQGNAAPQATATTPQPINLTFNPDTLTADVLNQIAPAGKPKAVLYRPLSNPSKNTNTPQQHTQPAAGGTQPVAQGVGNNLPAQTTPAQTNNMSAVLSAFKKSDYEGIWKRAVITEFGFPFINFSNPMVKSLVSGNPDAKAEFSDALRDAKAGCNVPGLGWLWDTVFKTPATLIKNLIYSQYNPTKLNYVRIAYADIIASANTPNGMVEVEPIKIDSVKPKFFPKVKLSRAFISQFFDCIKHNGSDDAMALYAKYNSQDYKTVQEYKNGIGFGNIPRYFIFAQARNPKVEFSISMSDSTGDSKLSKIGALLHIRDNSVLVKARFAGKCGGFIVPKDVSEKLFSQYH